MESDAAESQSGPEISSLIARFEDISRVLDATNSTLSIDPMLAELARELEVAGELEKVKPAVLWVLRSSDCSAAVEIVQFLAFRFRWQWLKIGVEEALLDATERRDLRAARAFEVMLEAFSDDWEDIDLFPSLAN
ncbi:hypothetical protein [Phaeacidiphilus oryzae]|uniref:hypothetical protein n=1 Tax=Phaeacidiphilus oryzae TaxID=348818 RepID=UPI00126A0890|nr:hypothetical protein [Phaeacidiphilus oryzae]